MTDTATVETLTAEVRVLMVGNRQVTLSVYRQLDTMPKSESGIQQFEPFGRVRTGATITRTDCWGTREKVDAILELVGRDSCAGALVRLLVYEDDPQVNKYIRERFSEWADLPLIVLAGLR